MRGNVFSSWSLILTILTLCIFILNEVNSVSFEEDTRITGKQAQILGKFKTRVIHKLPHKYMEQDIFLIKFLRAKNFDVDQAEDMLLNNLKWRKKMNMDRIDEEDWRDFQTEYPWLLTGTDKQGRPVVEMMLREWDIRKAVVTGRREQVTRWTFKIWEDASKLVRQLQTAGKNVTQFTMVIDAEGFNPVTHGCPMCIPYFLTVASSYEEQYPGSMHKAHIVNTPEFFRVILNLMWPLLTDMTKKSLKVHGTDRNAWMKEISKDIDPNQLLKNFGGYKEER